MKILVAIFTILLVTGCVTLQQAPYQAATQCEPIGIDINAPDFFQKHDQDSTDRFYDCMKAQLGSMPIIDDAANGYIGKKSLLIKLEFQKNLWRQVFTKEKSPAMAQESWMAWMQNERAIAAAPESAYKPQEQSKDFTCMDMGAGMVHCQ